MAEQKPKLDVVPEARRSAKKAHGYADPLESNRGGLSGIVETVLRRFKSLTHILMILPMYGLNCVMLGTAAAPGVALFESVYPKLNDLAPIPHAIALGTLAVSSYFAYGFSLLVVVPLFNFVLRGNLKPWRGPYYSLDAIRWYIHNGMTYMVRFTFLELVTPTPFSVFFYRSMGMKIGRGCAVNTTWISDPSMISIGDKVTIGGSVTIVAHYGQGGFLVLAPVTIEDRVTVGLKATIMGGVSIGADAKILPHSVVMPKTQIPAGETWGGVPAQRVNV